MKIVFIILIFSSRDYIKYIDADKNPELVELGKKYLSKAIFTIDMTEHK